MIYFVGWRRTVWFKVRFPFLLAWWFLYDVYHLQPTLDPT